MNKSEYDFDFEIFIVLFNITVLVLTICFSVVIISGSLYGGAESEMNIYENSG